MIIDNYRLLDEPNVVFQEKVDQEKGGTNYFLGDINVPLDLVTNYASAYAMINELGHIPLDNDPVNQVRKNQLDQTQVSPGALPIIAFNDAATNTLVNIVRNENHKLTKDQAVMIVETANKLAAVYGCSNTNFLVMWDFESGLDFTAKNIMNGTIVAYGLNQIFHTTAPTLGTSIEALRQMSLEEQLQYVIKYYTNQSNFDLWKRSRRDFIALYMLNFLPVLAPELSKKNGTDMIKTDSLTAKVIASWNKGFDLNKDNSISYGEFIAFIQKNVSPNFKSLLNIKFAGDVYTRDDSSMIMVRLVSPRAFGNTVLVVSPKELKVAVDAVFAQESGLRDAVTQAIQHAINGTAGLWLYNGTGSKVLSFANHADGRRFVPTHKWAVYSSIRQLYYNEVTIFTTADSAYVFLQTLANYLINNNVAQGLWMLNNLMDRENVPV